MLSHKIHDVNLHTFLFWQVSFAHALTQLAYTRSILLLNGKIFFFNTFKALRMHAKWIYSYLVRMCFMSKILRTIQMRCVSVCVCLCFFFQLMLIQRNSIVDGKPHICIHTQCERALHRHKKKSKSKYYSRVHTIEILSLVKLFQRFFFFFFFRFVLNSLHVLSAFQWMREKSVCICHLIFIFEREQIFVRQKVT